MRPFIYLLFVTSFLFSCQTEKTTSAVVEVPDSSTVDTSANEEEDMEDVQFFIEQRKQFMASYTEKVKMDTTFINKQLDTIYIQVEYYCLLDSAVVVPAEFVLEGGGKNFVTHTFAADIVVQKNSKVLFTKTIKKLFFENLLDENLKKYGVLLYPVLEGYDLTKNNVVIGFSISIPVTDVGVGVSLVVNTNTGQASSTDYYKLPDK